MATQATRIIKNCSTGEEVVETYEIPDPTPEEIEAQQAAEALRLREEWKQQRQQAVDAITVTVNGKVFDGDETSQTRMARAIIGMQAAQVASINWTLADNTVTQATVAELTEALILAGQAQAALWVQE
jgi:hypothetical protein